MMKTPQEIYARDYAFTNPIPLLKGEGGAKHRVRGTKKAILYPSPAASRHPLPSGEGLPEKQPLILRIH
jgi:hypothetical protein